MNPNGFSGFLGPGAPVFASADQLRQMYEDSQVRTSQAMKQLGDMAEQYRQLNMANQAASSPFVRGMLERTGLVQPGSPGPSNNAELEAARPFAPYAANLQALQLGAVNRANLQNTKIESTEKIAGMKVGAANDRFQNRLAFMYYQESQRNRRAAEQAASRMAVVIQRGKATARDAQDAASFEKLSLDRLNKLDSQITQLRTSGQIAPDSPDLQALLAEKQDAFNTYMTARQAHAQVLSMNGVAVPMVPPQPPAQATGLQPGSSNE